jgi:DNA-binding response OmpR family regulator
VSSPGIVIVDDEEQLASVIARYFERNGHPTHTVGDGLAAVELVRQLSPGVVILDLGLPGLDGIEVCRRIREFSDCYILMLTARAEEVDELIGLSVGADDYLTKPFSPRLLVARVQALLRRPRVDAVAPAAGMLTIGGLVINPASRVVTLDGGEVELTRTEFDLLSCLAGHRGEALTRDDLTTEVWGESWTGDDQLVDAHIGHLRKKLGENAATARFVQTVRGVGYRMGEGR